MIAPEDENEAEVRREDQDRINQFARLNARLNENRFEWDETKKALEGLDDASTELMMMGDNTNNNTIMILSGEAFFETNEDDAVAVCDAQVQVLQAQLDDLVAEEAIVLAQQGELKAALYGRFGKSINLEAD